MIQNVEENKQRIIKSIEQDGYVIKQRDGYMLIYKCFENTNTPNPCYTFECSDEGVYYYGDFKESRLLGNLGNIEDNLMLLYCRAISKQEIYKQIKDFDNTIRNNKKWSSTHFSWLKKESTAKTSPKEAFYERFTDRDIDNNFITLVNDDGVHYFFKKGNYQVLCFGCVNNEEALYKRLFKSLIFKRVFDNEIMPLLNKSISEKLYLQLLCAFGGTIYVDAIPTEEQMHKGIS